MSFHTILSFISISFFSGISVPRMHSVTGKFLPSTRSVSNFVHGTGISDLFEPDKSAMVMQWGQLLDHDFAHTPTLKGLFPLQQCHSSL